jgi:hypothetical protein
MKNKFYLCAMISSCLLTLNCSADTGSSNMPSPPRPCYPASMCTGGPRGSGTHSGYGYTGDVGNVNPMGPGGLASPQTPQSTSTQQFTGTVKTVNRVQLPNQTQVQLIVASDQGDILVILGPASFIDQAKIRFQAGDKVTITGYPVKANGSQVVLAAKVQKDGTTLQLLDENRKPMWKGSQSQHSGAQQYPGSSSYGPSYGGSSSSPYPGSYNTQNSYFQGSRY